MQFECEDSRGGNAKRKILQECLTLLERYKKEDVEGFFKEMKIEAILAVLDKFGRESGEAYIVFPDEKSVEEAKLKHKQKVRVPN